MSIFNNVLAWAAKNERPLGAALFAFGFFTDFFTFGVLPIELVNYFFIGYLALAAVSCLGSHIFIHYHDSTSWWKKTLSVLFPLGAQYAFGGLLSGFVVFYTAHSVVTVSWPFLIVLALVFVGNEYFRMYKQYLVFQTTLLFFSLYAYTIFGVPLILGSLGPLVFAWSTLAAVVLFALFLLALRLLNTARYKESRMRILQACAAILIAVSGSYMFGVIPPIPLVMKDAGMYHSLSKISGGYRVEGEAPREWWDLRTPVVHHVPNTYVYAYSAIAAPVKFGSTVVHRWERYDTKENDWITVSKVAFPITGGRSQGYRGYSERNSLPEGKWRVSVETANGQVIGRIRFDVETVEQSPELQEKNL